jgi:hypothetical protein
VSVDDEGIYLTIVPQAEAAHKVIVDSAFDTNLMQSARKRMG